MAAITRRKFLEMTGAGVGALAASPIVNARSPDVVVIGAGAFGGWAALYLVERGHAVTLVDAYGPGNARGSSAGETRQIRAIYGDRELYSRWVQDAFGRWNARGEEWGRKLFFRTGQITLLDEWTPYFESSKRVLDRLGLENEVVDRAEVVKRFPQFNHDGVKLGFYVPSTGILKCRESCLAVADAFERKGGKFTLAKAQPGGRSGGKLLDITLSDGRKLAAQSFVFACGPWHLKMFPEVFDEKLRLNRRVLFFMGTPADDARLTYPNCPTFTTRGVYGFPDFEGKGVKLGPYWDAGPLDPDSEDRTVTPEEVRRIHELVDSALPPLAGQPLLETRVSPRTNSVDGHFIVDRHPELDNVWLVGGGSGHGFKHGIVLGDYIAERVTGENTDPELDATFALKSATF